MSNDSVIKIWEQLAQEADECRFEQMPACVIQDLQAPPGYRAQICVRRQKVYHKAFEIKGRGWIQNTKTKEVSYESGQWMSESGAKTGLRKALEKLCELQAYREAMATKTKPVSQSTSLF